jgi:hypothetical protein
VIFDGAERVGLEVLTFPRRAAFHLYPYLKKPG